MAILSYPRGGTHGDTADKPIAKAVAAPKARLPRTTGENQPIEVVAE
jgi:hypothetical protein